MEIEDKGPIGVLYRDMVTSGAGFGAQRWLGALSNACDRYGALAALAVMNAADLGAGIYRLYSYLVMYFYFCLFLLLNHDDR